MKQNTHGVKTIGALPFFFQTTFNARKLGTEGMCELYEQRANALANRGNHAKAAMKFSEAAKKYASANEQKIRLHSKAAQAWESAAEHYPGKVKESKRDDVKTFATMEDYMRRAQGEYELASASCVGADQGDVKKRMDDAATKAYQHRGALKQCRNPFPSHFR
jgi:hypothetical protein